MLLEAVSLPDGVTGPGCKPAALFDYSKKIILCEQSEAFFIWDKYSHLAMCLHMIQPHWQHTAHTVLNERPCFQKDRADLSGT